jgi:hypothetical protein
MASKNELLSWLEINVKPPNFMRTYHSINLEDFEEKILTYNEELTKDIYFGDVFIIKNVVESSQLDEMKKQVILWRKYKEAKYQKMIVGAKDYHQFIAEDGDAKKYAIQPVRHSHFFFRWNEDPVGAFKYGNHIWGLVKLFGGFDYDSFTSDFSDENPIDRAQIAHYPIGAGLIPKHNDPWHNQKLILGVYMSKYGEDFEQGGIYFMNDRGKEVLLEDKIERGDAVVAFPTITHGVSRIDPHKEPDWETDKGRWFLGLYTNDSNAKKDRVTSKLAD